MTPDGEDEIMLDGDQVNGNDDSRDLGHLSLSVKPLEDLHHGSDDASQVAALANLDEQIANLRGTVAKIKRTKPSNGDAADDTNDEDDSDARMDDEQMFILDERITEVLRERKIHSKRQKDGRKKAAGNVVQLKNRVLDFLDIYVKQEYTNPLSLTILLPLLHLIRTTRSKQLSERASTLVRALCKKCKGGGPEAPSKSRKRLGKKKVKGGSLEKKKDDEDQMIHNDMDNDDDHDQVAERWDLLEQIHVEARKGSGSRPHATACSQSSLLLVRILLRRERGGHQDDDDNNKNRNEEDEDHRRRACVERIVDMYAETQKRWLLDRHPRRSGLAIPIQSTFFMDFINWGVSYGLY